jgi:hypothetical protein
LYDSDQPNPVSLTAITNAPPISRAAALCLIGCPDDHLPELLAAAREARDQFKPGVVTYSRKVLWILHLPP